MKLVRGSFISILLAVSLSLEAVTTFWLSLIEPMKEFVTGSAGVTQSEGLNLLGLSEIIDMESSSAISDNILSAWVDTGFTPA